MPLLCPGREFYCPGHMNRVEEAGGGGLEEGGGGGLDEEGGLGGTLSASGQGPLAPLQVMARRVRHGYMTVGLSGCVGRRPLTADL